MSRSGRCRGVDIVAEWMVSRSGQCQGVDITVSGDPNHNAYCIHASKNIS